MANEDSNVDYGREETLTKVTRLLTFSAFLGNRSLYHIHLRTNEEGATDEDKMIVKGFKSIEKNLLTFTTTRSDQNVTFKKIVSILKHRENNKQFNRIQLIHSLQLLSLYVFSINPIDDHLKTFLLSILKDLENLAKRVDTSLKKKNEQHNYLKLIEAMSASVRVAEHKSQINSTTTESSLAGSATTVGTERSSNLGVEDLSKTSNIPIAEANTAAIGTFERLKKIEQPDVLAKEQKVFEPQENKDATSPVVESSEKTKVISDACEINKTTLDVANECHAKDPEKMTGLSSGIATVPKNVETGVSSGRADTEKETED